MKVLISAYACEPGKGSEPGVGWNAAIGISQHHEVWVITRENNRAAIEPELEKKRLENLHFVFYDLPVWLRWWKQKQKGVHFYYYLWQIAIYFVARKLHQQISFDLVHHVTFVNYYRPSLLAMLPVPFIWGPVGGGESAPKSFWLGLGTKGLLFEGIRELSRWLSEFDPFVRITARRSAWAFATTPDTALRMRKLGAKNVDILSEAALSPINLSFLSELKKQESKPFRFLSLGRLLPLKGFHLGIEAFARANLDGAEYWIIGDGPDRTRQESLAKRLGVSSKVKFFGNLPRFEALQKMADCNVLVHPSLHDSGGWVCLEAMAAGLPVLCLDLGGPSQQVTNETGIKIVANNSRQVIADLSVVMSTLYRNGWSEQLAISTKRRVEKFYSLHSQNAKILSIYKNIKIKEIH